MGKIWRGELCYRTKYHADYWVEAAIVPLKNEFGKVEQYLSINYDITDKKRMLTELKKILNEHFVLSLKIQMI